VTSLKKEKPFKKLFKKIEYANDCECIQSN